MESAKTASGEQPAHQPAVEEAPPTEQRPLARLVMRLLPSVSGQRQTIAPDELAAAVQRWHWYASAGLLAATWLMVLVLEHVWPPARTTIASLAALIAGRWMDYTTAVAIFTMAGFFYFLLTLLGNPFTGLLRLPARTKDQADSPAAAADQSKPFLWRLLRALVIVAWMLIQALAMIIVGVVGLPYWLYKYRHQLRKLPQLIRGTFSPFNQQVTGRLRVFALHEERIFREGAEHWNWSERIRICVIFGAIHFLNLIYPVAVLIPLGGGAACFMWAYLHTYRHTGDRRQALINAGAFHYTYNRLALGIGFYVLMPGAVIAMVVLLILR